MGSKEIIVDFVVSQFQPTVAPDGVATPRKIWGYNEQLPGPTIRATEGDTIIVRVKNYLDEPTTIHWHGMYQRGTWFMDGVEQISQPRIPAEGGAFEYRFKAEPAGTHWYHSHTGIQYSEGLFGALIVEAKDDPYKDQYQQEFVVMINDWFNQPSEQIYKAIQAGTLPESATGGPDIGDVPFESALINGKGRYQNSSALLEVFQINQGTDVARLRIINASSTYAFQFTIDDHPFSVIAADGISTRVNDGKSSKSIVVHIGERYDILVPLNQNPDNYWIRSRTLEQDDATQKNLNHGVNAILRYSGAEAKEPTSKPDWGTPLSYFDLIPFSVLPPMRELSQTVECTLTLGGSMNPYRWSINENFFEAPVEAISVNPRPVDPPTTQINLGGNGGIFLLILNNTGMNHPFHLHGHSFYLLASASGEKKSPINSLTDLKQLSQPIFKDTISVPRFGGVQIYFNADNPGWWFFHCHIEWHLAAGMAILFKEGDPPDPS